MVETWLVLALLSAFFHGAAGLTNRFVLRARSADWEAYTFGYHALALLFFLPLLATEWAPPSSAEAWGLALLASVVWAAIGFVGFKSVHFADVTLRTPISRSRSLWTLLAAALLLGESITQGKLLGAALIIAGVVLVSIKVGRVGGLDDPGVRLTLLSAFLFGFVIVLDKAASAHFPTSLYGFLQYALPAVWIALVIPQRMDRFTRLLRGPSGKFLVLGALFDAAYYYLLIAALKLADAGLVAPAAELYLVVTAVGGIVLLRERTDLARRLVGTAVTLAGVLVLGA